ncbi:ComEC/Rec2 family competence protein [Treponema sp. R6D11]
MVKRSIKGILICLCLVLSFHTVNAYIAKSDITIDFVNVGQGDCALITSSGGRHMLIDAGKADSKTIENISSIAYLRSLGIKKIDVLSLSHYDDDHAGAIDEVAKLFDVEILFVPEPQDNKEIILFTEIAKNLPKDAKIMFPTKGDEMAMGDNLSVEVLRFNPNDSDSNGRSLVLRVNAYNTSAIFTGDIDEKIEDELIRTSSDKIDVDIAKAAHHGSKTSNSLAFFKALSPIYTVISVGKNSYGHPTREALDNIAASNSKIFRTDRDGGVRFIINHSKIKEKKL